MRTLRFVEIAEDGHTLVLAPDVPTAIDNGERYLLPIDERLRAASRGDLSRLGQIEIDLGVDLPPREIQSRIRAGESAEQVSAAAGMRLERIERYAYPVLQERARIADQAKIAKVRLSEASPQAPLGEFISERLAVLGAGEAPRWDASRPAAGTWEIQVHWRAGHKTGTARFDYDLTARSVTPVDTTTREFAEGPRLVRVPGETDESGYAAAHSADPGDHSADEDELSKHPTTPLDIPVAEERPARRSSPVDMLLGGDRSGARASRAPGADDPEGDSRAHDPRARIPSWEDIVFGVRRQG